MRNNSRWWLDKEIYKSTLSPTVLIMVIGPPEDDEAKCIVSEAGGCGGERLQVVSSLMCYPLKRVVMSWVAATSPRFSALCCDVHAFHIPSSFFGMSGLMR